MCFPVWIYVMLEEKFAFERILGRFLLAVHEATSRQSSSIVEDVLVFEALHGFHFLRLRVLSAEPSPSSLTHINTHMGIRDLSRTETYWETCTHTLTHTLQSQL